MEFIASLCVLATCAVGLGTQSSKRTTASKITVKKGKDVMVTGCVERTATGTGFCPDQGRRQWRVRLQ